MENFTKEIIKDIAEYSDIWLKTNIKEYSQLNDQSKAVCKIFFIISVLQKFERTWYSLNM